MIVCCLLELSEHGNLVKDKTAQPPHEGGLQLCHASLEFPSAKSWLLLGRHRRPGALRPAGARFLDLGGCGEVRGIEVHEWSLGQHFESAAGCPFIAAIGVGFKVQASQTCRPIPNGVRFGIRG